MEKGKFVIAGQNDKPFHMPQPRNDLFYTDGDQTTTTDRGRLLGNERTIADSIAVLSRHKRKSISIISPADKRKASVPPEWECGILPINYEQ